MCDVPALVDSNLLVYVFDRGSPRKREVCRKLVEDCWMGRTRYAVSVQNLSEFYVTVTEKVQNPIPGEVAQDFVELIVEFDGWRVLTLDGETVRRAIRIKAEYGAHYWDALIAAVMDQNGLRRLLTEDEEDFKKIPWLEVENPLM